MTSPSSLEADFRAVRDELSAGRMGDADTDREDRALALACLARIEAALAAPATEAVIHAANGIVTSEDGQVVLRHALAMERRAIEAERLLKMVRGG